MHFAYISFLFPPSLSSKHIQQNQQQTNNVHNVVVGSLHSGFAAAAAAALVQVKQKSFQQRIFTQQCKLNFPPPNVERAVLFQLVPCRLRLLVRLM